MRALGLVCLLSVGAACRGEQKPAPAPEPPPTAAAPSDAVASAPVDATRSEPNDATRSGSADNAVVVVGDAPIDSAAAGAIARAATWLAAFPADQLRFDAAIGLAAIRARVDSEALRTAYARAREIADRDHDNPMRRAFDDTVRVAKTASAAWPVPKSGDKRINVNRVLVEALHCKENGLRPETLAYITGPMRDEGGYHTTHAMWALTIARDRGCLPDFAKRAAPLVAELRAHQPAAPDKTVPAIDLYAERLLMLELAGEHGADIDAWRQRLIEAQAEDGGFGVPAEGEAPYFRCHATLAATWALAVSR